MNYANRLVENGVTIFLFHGVEDGVCTEVRNYTRKHIPKTDFCTYLEELKVCGTPVSMDDVVADRRGERPLPPYAFTITFDDGFENNLSVAAPVLAELGIPAMFYVTTDFIDSNRMSWIDRIEYVVEQVTSGRVVMPWGEQYFSNPAERVGLLKDIRHYAKKHPTSDLDAMASLVQEQLGFPETWSADHPLDRKLTWAQVSELAAGSSFSVGGHSHNHNILSFLDDTALENEIDVSLEMLREKGGIDITHYSYPEGLANCYDERVIAVLKSRGIVCAPNAIDGENLSDVDLFNLFRVTVV